MDNLQNLREKYWSGNSSLEDEAKLKSHLENNPGDNSPEQALFQFFAQEKMKTSQRSFNVPLNGHATKPQAKVFQLKRYVFSIAASVVLLAAAFWAFNNYDNSSSNEVIVTDPEVALQITKEAFALLNGKVGKSEELIRENIIHLDKTLIFKNL